MPPRKRTSSVLNGDAHVDAQAAPSADVVTDHDDVFALAEEAEAEAEEAEAAAAAARARARALKLRRQAEAAAARTKAAALAAPAVAEPEPEVAEPAAEVARDETKVGDELDGDASDEPARRRLKLRRLKLPHLKRPSLKQVAATLVIVCSIGFLVVGGLMVVHHRSVDERRTQSAEFAAAARQGVVTLMSLDFNKAKEDVQRIVDNTTGDFKKDFAGQADAFIKVAEQSKVVTTATVNATAVQSMTKDTATVLVAVTTNVSNAASKDQQPRSWRLSVDMARDGGQIKLAKVEFVP